MIAITFEQYIEEACEGGQPDAGYWNRVVDCLLAEYDVADYDDEGTALYLVSDLEAAEEDARLLLAS